MTEFRFFKLLSPIKNKIFLMIGRAVIKAINNDEGTQKVQIVGLKDETISDIERMQEYGFESYPKVDAEAVVLFQNGNRDQGVVVKVHDRRYRPKTLVEGEVCVYDWNGNSIILKAAEIDIEVKGGTLEFAPLASKIKALVDAQVNVIFNAHVHSGVLVGGAASGPPTTTMTDQAVTEYSSDKVKIT